MVLPPACPQVSLLLIVFKALYNICADDSSPPPGRSVLTEDEAATLQDIINRVRVSQEVLSLIEGGEDQAEELRVLSASLSELLESISQEVWWEG